MALFGHALTDEAGFFLSIDFGFCEILQRDRAELLERDLFDVTAPADRQENAARLDLLRLAETPFTIQKRYVRGDGSLVWVRNQVSLIHDGLGATRIIATVTTLDLAPRGPVPGDLLAAAHFLLDSRRRREDAFDAKLFADPAWDLLLLGYVCEAEGRAIDLAAMCEGARIRWPVGERWARHLMSAGLIEIEGAPRGSLAAQSVRLSNEGHRRFEAYLTEMVAWQRDGGRRARR